MPDFIILDLTIPDLAIPDLIILIWPSRSWRSRIWQSRIWPLRRIARVIDYALPSAVTLPPRLIRVCALSISKQGIALICLP